MTDGQKLDILGTEYTVRVRTEDEDPILKNCAGYCDNTLHTLTVETVVGKAAEELDLLGDYPVFQKRALRHEIIHAYLFECGLGGDADYGANGGTHPEMMIDWFARMAPKIWKTWEEAGAL